MESLTSSLHQPQLEFFNKHSEHVYSSLHSRKSGLMVPYKTMLTHLQGSIAL